MEPDLSAYVGVEAEPASQAMWPGKRLTSSTTMVRRSRAAAPQTPREKGMRRQPSVPW